MRPLFVPPRSSAMQIVNIIVVMAILAALGLLAASFVNAWVHESNEKAKQEFRDSCAGMAVEIPEKGVMVCYPRNTDLGRGIKSKWSEAK